MKIKLSDINTYVLTIERNIHRLEKLKQCLNGLENKLNINVYYGDTIKGYLGCAISTVKMYKSIIPPGLCLEDDCSITEHYSNTLDVPDDADAVYLGTSVWGAKDGRTDRRNFNIEKYNDDYYRIEGMCSTHAVLFLNDNYLSRLNEIGKSYDLNASVPFDYLMCQEQYKFKVYGVAKPMFYQRGTGRDKDTLGLLERVFKDKNNL